MKIANPSCKNRSSYHWTALAAASLLVAALAGCGGSDDPAPAAAPAAPAAAAAPIVVVPTAAATTLAATAASETCSLCHAGTEPTLARSGPKHQTEYDELNQNGIIKVTGLSYAWDGTSKSTLTFTMTKKDSAGVYQPFYCTTLDGKVNASKQATAAIGSYWSAWDDTNKKFQAAVDPSYLSLWPVTAAASAASTATTKPTVTGTVADDSAGAKTGLCTVVKDHSDFATTKTATTAKTAADNITAAGKIAAADGIIQLYGADEIAEISGSIRKSKYPFAAVLRLGPAMGVAVAPYTSAANVSGCENCHTQPFNKHAYLPGTADDNTPGAAAGTTQQFYTCKGCHSDARNGGHNVWQAIKEAKIATETDLAAKLTLSTLTDGTKALRARAVAVHASESNATAAEKTKWAYKARLMNDVHMSHAMEFAYPQSMRNCVTCHDTKMDTTTGIFKNANFQAETCISCHSVDGITAKMKAASYNHSSFVASTATLKATDCSKCHDGSAAPTFTTVHTGGYDPLIYDASGTRYSTSIKVSIDSATVASNVLTVKFSATGSVGSLAATSITPTIIVGLYGYNTKDFIVAAHGYDADRKRLLEYKWGDKNPRFTEVSGSGGKWEVKADLSAWKDMIAAGTIKRAEIAVLPELKSGTKVLGLDAPSKTFDLTTNAFVTYFSDIVNVQKTAVTNSKGTATIKGCNTCHDQLATTFHSGIRGGNIKVCRLCHVKSAGGSHLELQSRSIDTYVHAIHSFQKFDPGDIDFTDTFEAMEYDVHIGTEFPRFGQGTGATDCESCHVSKMYAVSDQSKSLPALLSGTDTIKGKTRTINTTPQYVTGPAAAACGGCHRAQKINEDDGPGLVTLFQHWKGQGYLLENVDTLWDATVAKVMATFK